MQTLDQDNQILLSRLRYLEWVTAVFAAGAQLSWTWAAVNLDWQIAVSFLLLAVFCLLSFYFPRSLRGRLTYLLGQSVTVCLASALGAHHFFYLILFVLAAKAAVFLPQAEMLTVSGIILVCHVASGQFHHYAMRNIHVHKRPVPDYYKFGIVEGDTYLYFVISLVTASFLGRTLIAERKNRNAEQKLKEEVEQLAVRLDRERIAREIHDGLGHSLTSSKIQLELSLKALEEKKAEQALELIGRSQASTAASLQEVRQAVRTDQHGILSLKQTVILLVEEIKQQSDLTFRVQLDDIRLTPKVQHQVFSIIKECLTNVRKHSAAGQVEITLTERDGQASLSVRDNGKGFELDSTKSGFGLKGLAERAESIKANIKIESKVGIGTEISLCFPTSA